MASHANLSRAVQFHLHDDGVTVSYDTRFCTRCVLPDVFPDVDLDDAGVCAYCRSATAPSDGVPGETLAAVRAILDGAAPERRYDCLVLYSGGKDSSIALDVASRHFGLRVLALTLDNGFLAEQTLVNIRHVVASLGVDHLLLRPAVRRMHQLYRLSLTEPFGTNTIKYSTSACGSCISLLLATATELAQEKKIPLLAGGWTPGQFTTDPLLQREFLRSVVVRHMETLDALSGEPLAVFPRIGSWESAPALFNPLYLGRYDEEDILSRLEAMGWRRPTDTDSCSTNCRLNGLLVVDHLSKYGFHPYAFELAHHVRSGFMLREAAFDRMSRLNISARQLAEVCSTLDIPSPLEAHR